MDRLHPVVINPARYCVAQIGILRDPLCQRLFELTDNQRGVQVPLAAASQFAPDQRRQLWVEPLPPP
ncbi:MAG TPA: hypothetical protein VEL76_03235 [Gemmataceae bacterium]|nr:hypothetical protein [Gemmataceae bacterium]